MSGGHAQQPEAHLAYGDCASHKVPVSAIRERARPSSVSSISGESSARGAFGVHGATGRAATVAAGAPER
jgi:hypothetical protein